MGYRRSRTGKVRNPSVEKKAGEINRLDEIFARLDRERADRQKNGPQGDKKDDCEGPSGCDTFS